MNDISEAFELFESEALRFEALPAYQVATEESAVNSYLNGAPLPDDFNEPWLKIVRDAARTQRRIRRLRVIDRPLTLYQAFEIDFGYRYSAAEGEEIYICERGEIAAVADELPPDFWAFDGQFFFEMRYGPSGDFLAAEYVENGAARDHLKRFMLDALELGRPLREHLAWSRNSVK